jgi:HEAT repeat protein
VADFYAAHGDRRHVPIVVAMLFDPEPIVCYSAADAIVKIGSPEALVAVESWLDHSPHPEEGDLRHHVVKCRDELKQRLEKRK